MNKELLGEFSPTEMDIRLYEMAKEYHELTEEYDKTVCSVINERGVAMPKDGYELALINRNANSVRSRLLSENKDIDKHELSKAIQRYNIVR